MTFILNYYQFYSKVSHIIRLLRQNYLTLLSLEICSIPLVNLATERESMSNSKVRFLKQEGLINPKPERVEHFLFESIDFFDPLDLPQVRYEMLRLARGEGVSVARACRLFGFSREYFYQLERSFLQQGFRSVLGSPKGRRPLIALNQEIVNFVAQRRLAQPKLSGEDLRKEILAIYKVTCSRRTVERIMQQLGPLKKGLRTS